MFKSFNKIISIILEEKAEKIERMNKETSDKKRSPFCLMRNNIKTLCIRAGKPDAWGLDCSIQRAAIETVPCTERRI